MARDMSAGALGGHRMTLRRRCGHALVLVGAQLLMACQASAAPPSEKAFAAEMRKRLEAKLKVSLDPVKGEPLSFRIPPAAISGENGVINLHRIYGFCLNAPEACEENKMAFIDGFDLKPPAITAENLRLAVRDRDYLASVEDAVRNGELPDMPVHEQIGDDLYAILAADGPNSVAMLPPSALKEIGLTRKAAWARARAQTSALLPAVPKTATLRRGIVIVEDHDYGASLLLDKAAWGRLATAIGPDLLITVVSDHLLLVGVMPDGPDLDRFSASVAEDCKQQPRCISPHVYRFRKGKWVIAR